MPVQISPAKIYPLLDWFIPDAMRAEADALRRARMFLISHLFGPFLGHTISLFILFLQPHPAPAWWVFFGAITAFWAFPLALKLTGWFVPLAVISVQNLIFTILWGCYHYGGTSSPLIPWLITVPLLAFFYLGSGKSVRIYVISIILVNLAAFYAIYTLGDGFPEHIPLAKLSGLGIVSTLCASVYVSMMALYYANIASSQGELEHEIKKRLETAAELRRATVEAERANRAKSEFLAKMSHELRTPLNAVIGYSAIMLDEVQAAEKPQQRRDLKKIHDAGKRLLKLITDLLDLSKLEAGKMDLFVEEIDVSELVAGVVDELHEQIADSGNHLSIDCAKAGGPIAGDIVKLRRAVFDLVSNAVKYTRNGRVSVVVRREQEHLEIEVTDTGPGIGASQMERLFEYFEESEDATSTKYDDTGIGLPVSQRVCRLMGGEITAESAPGKGSTFTIRIPTKLADDAQRMWSQSFADQQAERAGDRVVLVVGQDPAVSALVRSSLNAQIYHVVDVADAAEACELTKKLAPALILLDLTSVQSDLARELDRLKRERRLQCLIVTLADHEAHAIGGVGTDAHLLKPLHPEALASLLIELGLEGKTNGHGAAAPDSVPPLRAA